MLPGVERSLIIKIVAIYFVIAGIFGLCGGVALLGIGGMAGIMGAGGAAVMSTSGVDTLSAEGAAAAGALAAAGGLAAIIGILLVVQAPIMLVVAYGLFQRKAWARMGTVIIAAISVVLNLLQVGSGLGAIVWIIISGFIAYLFYTDPGIQQELSA